MDCPEGARCSSYSRRIVMLTGSGYLKRSRWRGYCEIGARPACEVLGCFRMAALNARRSSTVGFSSSVSPRNSWAVSNLNPRASMQARVLLSLGVSITRRYRKVRASCCSCLYDNETLYHSKCLRCTIFLRRIPASSIPAVANKTNNSFCYCH